MAPRLSLALIAVVALVAGAPAGVFAATECRDLAQLRLPGVIIRTAAEISGTFEIGPDPRGEPREPLDLPPICRVAGTIQPAIRFEAWLPAGSGYNGRLQTVGGGGLAGSVRSGYPAMGDAVAAGYATAATDTGHDQSDTFWVANAGRREDFGSRSIHEMTVTVKTIVDEYYGIGPEYSYFNGCSTGGRQGLMEAQRYPNDYDGIVSGAPVNDFTRLHMGQLWTAHATLIPADSVLTADDLHLVNAAVMAACDANDGIEDGILTDPGSCNFNPRELVCRRRADQSCLVESKVRALEKIYQGATNPRTGVPIYPGLEPGGENGQPNNAGWAMIMDGKQPFGLDIPVLGGMGFENGDWDWRTLDFDTDVALIDAKLAHVLNAVDPDMSDFRALGGKLIVWHGWSDPGVMPQRTIDYYDDIIAFADRATNGSGKSLTDEYLKLYMLPGVGHCRGGVGPDKVDWMSAIAGWVENDQAPERLIAGKADGSITRPVCPHPETARYVGGDTNDPASFRCE